MDDAVADSVDGIHGFDDAAFSVGEDVEDEFDSDLVIRDGLFDFLLLAIPFVGQLRIGKADFSTKPFAITSSLSMLMSWYFKDELPQFTTNTIMQFTLFHVYEIILTGQIHGLLLLCPPGRPDCTSR